MSGIPDKKDKKYESVFRIDGKPILPPLVTLEMKAEMQKLREKAMQLEQQFANCRRTQRQCENITIDSDNSEKAETIIPCNNQQCKRGRSMSRDLELDASFQTITNWLKEDELNNNFNKKSKPIAPSYFAHDRLNLLKRTETVAFDNRFKTVIYPTNNVVKYVPNEYTVVHMSKLSNQCWMAIDVSKLDKSREKMVRGTKSKTDQTKSKVPSICVCPPTPLTEAVVLKNSILANDNTTLLHIADTDHEANDGTSSDSNSLQSYLQNSAEVGRRLTLSFSQSDSSLVRSSSFTVPEPSPALRNHMLTNNLECGSLDTLNMSQQIGISKSTNNVECSRSRIRSDTDSDVTINNYQTVQNGAIKKKPETHETFILAGNRLTDSIKNNLANSNPQNQAGTKYRSPYTIAKKATAPTSTLTAKVKPQKNPQTRPQQSVSRNQLSSSATRDTIESKAKRVQKVNTKQSPPFRQQQRYPTGYNQNALSARNPTISQKPYPHTENRGLTARERPPVAKGRCSPSDCSTVSTIYSNQRNTPNRDLLSTAESQLYTSILKQEEERKRLLDALNAEKNLLICNANHRTVVIPDIVSLTSNSSVPHSDADSNRTDDGITSIESSYCDGIPIQSARHNSPPRSPYTRGENRQEMAGTSKGKISRLKSPTVLSSRMKK